MLFLDLLELALHQAGVGFARIDGQKSFKLRVAAMAQFNEVDSCTVMIATIGSVGEG